MTRLFALSLTFCFFFIAVFTLVNASVVFKGLKLFDKKYNNDSNLNADEIIKKFGYPVEGYTIETSDGYLLEMHRIPHGKSSHFLQRKPPVLIQHGVFCNSGCFLWLGPDKGLPFILADEGYDVWLGNTRGNSYSRAHISLTPKDHQFWNFTWNEVGLYDLSAQIDFIIDNTGFRKIFYVGHSMGATTFFVLMSKAQEYNKKIRASFLLAPIAYMKNVHSFLLRFLATFTFSPPFYKKYVGESEFPRHKDLWHAVSGLVCKNIFIAKRLCSLPTYLFAGVNPRNYEKNVTNALYSEFPDSFSSKGLIHYLQLIKSGKFRQFDYGLLKNLITYGRKKPPEYNLKYIITPIYFYLAKNDWLVTMPNIYKLADSLRSLKSVYITADRSFNHLDFFASTKAKSQVFDKLLFDLEKYKWMVL